MKRLADYHSSGRSTEETVRWALEFGGHGYFKLQTQQKLSEITSLARAVAAISPRTILEIGTAHGGTLLIWAALASDTVISCDLVSKDVQAEFLRSLPPPGSACKVTLLQGDSHSARFRERIIGTLEGRHVDFLFIDGDHTREGALADFESYSPLVRPGGLVAFHDIVELQPLATNQVFSVWESLKHRFEYSEFIDDPNQRGYGIGLLRMP